MVSPGSTNQSPAIVNPEGGSSIAPVVNIEAVTTGCQSSKQQTKSLDPLVLKDLSSTFRDTKVTKGHTKSKVPKHREVSVAPSSSSSGNENNDMLNDSFTTVSTLLGVSVRIYIIFNWVILI